MVNTEPTTPPTTEPTAPAPEFVPVALEGLKIPDGFELDEATSGKFLETFNNQELSPEARAQALLDLHAEVLTSASEANSQAWTEMQDQWQNEVRSDPEIGGQKLQTTLTSVGKLLDQFGTPELRSVFDLTGAGNNVHMVKFLASIASHLTESSSAVQGSPAGAQASLAERMYPSMVKRS